jgi:hypothetical protein
MREIVIYNYDTIPEKIRIFEEVLVDRRLRHLATELALFGIKDPAEIMEAIEKAMKVCQTAGVPVAENFKPVFFCKRNNIFRDWRLSDLAMKLAILNAGIHHEIVSRTQVDVVKRSLGG